MFDSEQLILRECDNVVQMVLVHSCDVVVEYLLRACRRGQRSTLVHVFRALATVLFENAGRTAKVLCRSHVTPV